MAALPPPAPLPLWTSNISAAGPVPTGHRQAPWEGGPFRAASGAFLHQHHNNYNNWLRMAQPSREGASHEPATGSARAQPEKPTDPNTCGEGKEMLPDVRQEARGALRPPGGKGAGSLRGRKGRRPPGRKRGGGVSRLRAEPCGTAPGPTAKHRASRLRPLHEMECGGSRGTPRSQDAPKAGELSYPKALAPGPPVAF